MKKQLYFPLIILVFTTVYLIGSFDRIPFADCIGFVLTAELGKMVTVATPTSHFFYINSVILTKNLLGTDGILASRIVVVLSGAITVGIVYKIAEIISEKIWISIVTAFIFGLSFTFWRNAEIVEVYTFASIWVSLFFYIILKSLMQKFEPINLVITALILCCCLWSHIQNIFLIPTFLLFLYKYSSYKKYVLMAISLLILSFLVMFLLNSSQGLPLRSIYSSEAGHWVEDSLKKTGEQYVIDVLKAILYLIYNFNIFTMVGIFGIYSFYQKHRNIFWILLPAAALNFGFATFYAVTDNYVFFLPFYIIFAAAISFGLYSYKNQTFLKKISPIVFAIPLFYLVSFNVAMLIPATQDFHQKKLYKGGLNYYLLPWMNDNKGIVEFTLEKKVAPDPVNWMTPDAEKFIKLKLSQGFTKKEIGNF